MKNGEVRRLPYTGKGLIYEILQSKIRYRLYDDGKFETKNKKGEWELCDPPDEIESVTITGILKHTFQFVLLNPSR